MEASPEGISVYLENLDLKKNSMRKAILMLAVEWKYLDDHLDLTTKCFNDLESERKKLEFIRDSLIESNRELEVVRESLEAREREVESREQSFVSFQQTQLKNFEMKEEQLAGIRIWVVGKMEEAEMQNERLSEQKESVELLLGKFQLEKNEFEDTKKDVGQKLSEICLKEKNIDDRSKEIHLIQDWVERRAGILDSREEEVEMREQQLKAMQQCFNDVEDKTKQLKDEQKLFEESCKKFDSKEKQLEEQSKNFDLILEQIDERWNDIMLKETKLEEHFEEFESKEKQLEEQYINFDSIEFQFEERWKNLLSKVIQLEERTKAFESKQLQKRKGQKRAKPDSDCKNPTKHSEESKLFSSVIGSTSPCLSPLLANMDGNNLLLVLSKHVEVHEFMRKEVYVALRTSSNPGKLVLNATQGFLSPVLMEVDGDIDMRALRSCIFLLDILMSVKPVISYQVKTTSRRLAVDWKVNAKMREGNSLLTFGLSRFISAYGLTTAFDPDELLNINKHTQTPQLSCALSWSKDRPANLVLDAIEGCYNSKSGSQILSKFEILKSLNFLLSQLLKVPVEVTPQIKEQAMKIAANWKEKVKSKGFSEIRCFLLFLATYKVVSSCNNGELFDLLEVVFAQNSSKTAVDLLRSLGLEDEVPNYINILVERGMHLDAIKYVCAFKLGDKFPPATLLKDYITYEEAAAEKIREEGCFSVKAKDNAAKKELDALKAVVNCSRQHKLESQYPLKNIEARINQLKRQRLVKGERDDSRSEAIHKKKRKSFVTEHANNTQFHPLRAEKIPYQHPHSVHPLQSPPCLIPREGYFCSVGSTHDPPFMNRPSFGFCNNDDFVHFPNFEARPGAISELRYWSPVRDQNQMHWR